MEVYRIPFSTNVERVALGAGHKGLEVDWVDVDAADRSEVERVSGQRLVPVLVDDGRVVVDSTDILRYLEVRTPDPPLFPSEPSRRAAVDIFLDWFNRVWKRPPNEMEAELSKPEDRRDMARVDRLGKAMAGYLDLFEAMLTGRDHLLGEFSAADIAAFPFVKYAVIPPEPGDTYLFHRILTEHQKPGSTHPRVSDWIARMDRRPRA